MKVEGEGFTKVLGRIFRTTQYYITYDHKLDDGGDDYYDYAADTMTRIAMSTATTLTCLW
jgi:hypothetical protein